MAPWIAGLKSDGYEFRLIYVWLRSPDLAIRRMRARVRRGGHFVPPETIRRRYARSVLNFVSLYSPIATTVRVYDNSSGTPSPIARRARDDAAIEVFDHRAWDRIQGIARHEADEQADDQR